ncbi:MAG: hypothetical protein AAF772_06385 [Acidobacteriota bacterium]
MDSKALDNAAFESLEKELKKSNDTEIALTEKLKNLPEQQINLYVEQYIGSGSVQKLNQEAQNSEAEPRHYKALALAREKPQQAAAIVENQASALTQTQD